MNSSDGTYVCKDGSIVFYSTVSRKFEFLETFYETIKFSFHGIQRVQGFNVLFMNSSTGKIERNKGN